MINLREGEIPEVRVTKPYALVAITKHGVANARKYAEKFPYVDVYYMKKFEQGDEAEKIFNYLTGRCACCYPHYLKHISR